MEAQQYRDAVAKARKDADPSTSAFMGLLDLYAKIKDAAADLKTHKDVKELMAKLDKYFDRHETASRMSQIQETAKAAIELLDKKSASVYVNDLDLKSVIARFKQRLWHGRRHRRRPAAAPPARRPRRSA